MAYLTAYNPVDVVRSFFGDVADSREAELTWTPRVNVYDLKESVIVEVELPGVDKKDISMDVEDGVLKVQGERAQHSQSEKSEYKRAEGQHGKFARSFRLGKDMDADSIKASHENGVLTIEVSRKEKALPKRIEIK